MSGDRTRPTAFFAIATRQLRWLLIAALLAAVAASVVQGRSASAEASRPARFDGGLQTGCTSWTGTWSTDFGTMQLSQTGGTVTGSYETNAGRIIGVVSGNTLNGTWSEQTTYQPPDHAGDFRFTLSPDGSSFTGGWRYGSSGGFSSWGGARTCAGAGLSPAAGCTTWAGTWSTDYGTMQLTQSGSSVIGAYDYQGGRLSGTVSGNVLSGSWSELPSYTAPNDAGDFVFTLASEGSSFTGGWRYGSSGGFSSWGGTRTCTTSAPPGGAPGCYTLAIVQVCIGS
jgi:hypothetical protein